MRIHISRDTTDPIQDKKQVRSAWQALQEFGVKPATRKDGTPIDGYDFFDVVLPNTMKPEDVEHLLTCLGARGVDVQPEDLRVFLTDPYEKSVITELMAKSLIDNTLIPVEDIGNTIGGWAASTWMSSEELSEAEEQAAYESILKRLPADDTSLSPAPEDNAPAPRGSLQELLDESDTWLTEHAAENPGIGYEQTGWAARRQG
ncbi:MAG: hypothetical protein ACRD3E_11580 [Terriglobales bacterium]